MNCFIMSFCCFCCSTLVSSSFSRQLHFLLSLIPFAFLFLSKVLHYIRGASSALFFFFFFLRGLPRFQLPRFFFFLFDLNVPRRFSCAPLPLFFLLLLVNYSSRAWSSSDSTHEMLEAFSSLRTLALYLVISKVSLSLTDFFLNIGSWMFKAVGVNGNVVVWVVIGFNHQDFPVQMYMSDHSVSFGSVYKEI